jgi:hypothetical protein
MKVTRKVGRRSRSSVSRRRLRNNKNKKVVIEKKNANTQRGGKRGRGQKRVRVHTHKRGKRFHKGGKNMPFFVSVPPATIEWHQNDKWRINEGHISNLRYKKSDNKGGFKDKYDNFKIEIFKKVDKKGITIYNFLFTKLGGKSDLIFLANSINSNSLDEAKHYLCDSIRNGYAVDYLLDRIYNFETRFASDPTLAKQVEQVEIELAPVHLPDLSKLE